MSTPAASPEFIYKITTAAAYAPARLSGSFIGMPIDAQDGYMHFSTAPQLPETLRLHFAGQASDDLGDSLVWEPSRGGELFPHLYGGPLALADVVWEAPISVGADGSCALPGEVR